jgi:hypothetical protein
MALPMAQNAVDLRIARLRHDLPVPGRARRVVACVLTALTAVSLPFVAGSGLLVAIAVVACRG